MGRRSARARRPPRDRGGLDRRRPLHERRRAGLDDAEPRRRPGPRRARHRRRLDEIESFFARHEQPYYVSLNPQAKPSRPPRTARGAAASPTGYAWMKFTRGVEPPPRDRDRSSASRRSARIAAPTSARSSRPATSSSRSRPPGSPSCRGRAGAATSPTTATSRPAPPRSTSTTARGYLCFAATRPEHRRKGAQSALLVAADPRRGRRPAAHDSSPRPASGSR